MYEFSIEQAANKIHDHRSREYFGEVMNNYFNGNYRSSAVMLWTVVICDLVYKLQYLKDIHNDEKAIAILDGMIEFQTRNPTNPNWESNLLKEIHERTSLLESHELDSLETLQKHRHLSAHPVLSKTDILFKPNREMVLCDIRVALDSVLTKPPILTKHVFNELVEDLERIKDLFAEDSELKRYLCSRYFSNLNKEVSIHLFKSLWRITFKIEDERCNQNRQINYEALRIIFEDNRELFTEDIKNNSHYYSEISDNDPIKYAIFFLGDYPYLFESLTEAAKAIIRSKAESRINLLTISYFLSNNIAEHIAMLIAHIESDYKRALRSTSISQSHIKDLIRHASSAGVKESVNKLLIKIYVNAADFDAGDSLFAKFIKPHISQFHSEDVQELIKGIGENNQTHWRGRAASDHEIVVKRAEEVIVDFDVCDYNFLPQSTE